MRACIVVLSNPNARTILFGGLALGSIVGALVLVLGTGRARLGDASGSGAVVVIRRIEARLPLVLAATPAGRSRT